MKFFKEIKKSVKKIESVAKKMKHKVIDLKNDKKVKKIFKNVEVIKAVLPVVSPFLPLGPVANAIPYLDQISKMN